ncbi:MAG: class A beta-lactamase-related serine hydrolase [Chloroflexi bacterium]|nr:class A beta-lactamase-related serine hydrolase [Gemmatimonadota bacterium]MDA1009844.1 class A beta-lactamase-related serine hydrolase [Chloroflexota bacterium]
MTAAAALLVQACGPAEPMDAPGSAAAGTLQERVAAALDALPARTGMYARAVETGEEVAVRADEPVNTLSTIKVPVMILAYRDAEAGRLDLDERYTVREEDLRRGSGLLQHFQPGLHPTYRDLVTQMIITSDNTATDIVIRRVGMDRVNDLLVEWGYAETRVLNTTGGLFRRVWEMLDPAYASLSDLEVYRRGFPQDEQAATRSFAFEGDPREWLGRTTPREMSRLLAQLHAGELAGEASTREMISILRRQFYATRLPLYVGGRASIAHKTGDWPPIAGNDVGILYGAGQPIVVSVFATQNRGDFAELEATHGRIAQMLLDAWGGER